MRPTIRDPYYTNAAGNIRFLENYAIAEMLNDGVLFVGRDNKLHLAGNDIDRVLDFNIEYAENLYKSHIKRKQLEKNPNNNSMPSDLWCDDDYGC